MTTESYDLGQVVRIELAVTAEVSGSPDQEPADPGALTLTLLEPDGTETPFANDGGSPEPITGHPATGGFYVDVVARVPGRHFWRWHGTGSARGATQGEFWVRRQNAGAS